MPQTVLEDQLSETFAALAHPTRRAILSRLAEGEASVNELAEPFDMTLPAISRHIKVLERAGLITQERRAQYRPCTLNTEGLQHVSAWADHYRHVWEERFDRLHGYVQELTSNEPEPTQQTKGNSDDH